MYIYIYTSYAYMHIVHSPVDFPRAALAYAAVVRRVEPSASSRAATCETGLHSRTLANR